MQLLQNLLQFAKVISIKVQLPKFRVGFEPEPIVFGILQCLKCCFIEILEQFHLNQRNVISFNLQRRILQKVSLTFFDVEI